MLVKTDQGGGLLITWAWAGVALRKPACLQNIGPVWWGSAVVSTVSTQQQRHVRGGGEGEWSPGPCHHVLGEQEWNAGPVLNWEFW